MPDPTPRFLAGATLSASKLQELGHFGVDWAPALDGTTTDPTLGTGAVQTSHIWLNGNMVDLWFNIQFGTSGVAAGSGNYGVILPAAYPAMADHIQAPAGMARLVDNSSSSVRLAIATLNLASQLFTFRTADDGNPVTSSAPWTWAASDLIAGHFRYITDFGA